MSLCNVPVKWVNRFSWNFRVRFIITWRTTWNILGMMRSTHWIQGSLFYFLGLCVTNIIEIQTDGYSRNCQDMDTRGNCSLFACYYRFMLCICFMLFMSDNSSCSYRNLFTLTVSSRLVSPHLVSSRLISSHLILSYVARCDWWLLPVHRFFKAGDNCDNCIITSPKCYGKHQHLFIEGYPVCSGNDHTLV